MRPAYAAPAFASLALLLAGPAFAQAQGRPSDAPSSYSQSGDSQSGYAGQQSSADDRYPAQRAGGRPGDADAPEGGDPSQDLVRQLNLRSDQQAAFRNYQSAFQAPASQGSGAGGADGQDDVARLAAMTTPQRLDDSARQMDRDRADFERVAAATRRFYAALDAGQRRTFDRLTAPQAQPDDEADGPPDDDRAPTPQRRPTPQR